MSNFGANGIYRHHHEASPDYVHHPSELYSDKLEESPPLPSPTSKEKDASHKLFETITEAVEIRKLSKQHQSFSSPPSSFLGQLPGTVGLTMSLFNGSKTGPSNQVNHNYAPQFCNVLTSNKNVGFRHSQYLNEEVTGGGTLPYTVPVVIKNISPENLEIVSVVIGMVGFGIFIYGIANRVDKPVDYVDE